MPALLALAPVPALAAALLASGGTLALPPVLLRIGLALDVPGALLLGVAAMLWIAAGFYATAWLRGRPDADRFAVWWLLTLTGSLGVFMAADLVSFYLVFSMVSLAAYGLIVDEGTPRARRYGLIYVALAVLGEAFLLMALVLLAEATPGDSLLIADAVGALSASPWRDSILALLILGFGVKIGLVPFHVWMPLAYRAAPIPAAAVLSGAAVKAGVIGLIRFLPLDAALPGWGEALAAAGLVSAFYGVAIGITQSNPKTVLAFSQREPDGRDCRGAWHGAGRGRRRGRAVCRLLCGAPYAGERCAVSCRGGRSGDQRAPALAGAATGGGDRARPRRAAADRRRTREAGCEGDAGRWHRRPACDPVFGRDHASDAAFSAPPCSNVGSRCDTGTGPVFVAMDRHGVASVAVPWVLYLTVMGGTVSDALAPAALWSAGWPVLLGGVPGDRALAMGRQLAADSGGGCRGAGGGRRQGPRSCHGLDAGAAGRRAARVGLSPACRYWRWRSFWRH